MGEARRDAAGDSIVGEFAKIVQDVRAWLPDHCERADSSRAAGWGSRFASCDCRVGKGYNVGLLILSGQASVEGSQRLSEAELGVFVSTGEPVTVSAEEDATILVMAGEGIHEPVARYGPFVMNTKAELVQAVNDYQAGKMGHLD